MVRRSLKTSVALALVASVAGCGTERPPNAPSASAPLRGHPHVLQPTAGVQPPVANGSGSVPLGDPTAHAPPLSQVRRELKILNRCGGATSSAFATPFFKAKGPGFVADPGTIQNLGYLPLLTARLDALGKALGVTIYGISGYRTPAHSVAVGGYADDPHTKGLAEDIGVNSLLRSSAAQISEAELARFGLYRPFDPSGSPNSTEVNHIQLIPAGGVLSLSQAQNTFAPDPICQ